MHSVKVTAETRKKQELEKIKVDLEAANSCLRGLLKLDDLTGLYGRRAFEEQCIDALDRLETGGVPFSLMSIDMGALTLYNRRLGGLAVDGMLRSVARVISLESPSFQTAARISGAGFRVLASDTTPSQHGLMMAGIRSNISAVRWLGGVLSPKIDARLFEDRNLHPGDLFSSPVRPARGQNRYRIHDSGMTGNPREIDTAHPNVAQAYIYARAKAATERDL